MMEVIIPTYSRKRKRKLDLLQLRKNEYFPVSFFAQISYLEYNSQYNLVFNVKLVINVIKAQ